MVLVPVILIVIVLVWFIGQSNMLNRYLVIIEEDSGYYLGKALRHHFGNVKGG